MYKGVSRLPLALLGLLPLCSMAEDISCASDKRLEEGASSGNSATISITGKKITALKVESYNASGEEGGAYFCSLDTADKDSRATWSVSGSDTTLEIETLGETSHLTVKHVGDAYVINFEDVKRVYCGFGAEWPGSVTVTAKKKECIVK
jgi:hypothetical protein